MNKLLHQSNVRILNILRIKKLIPKKEYEVAQRILENELHQGRQPSLDAVKSIMGIISYETLCREFFKYNQIILKLSHQFLTNTVSRKLNPFGEDTDSTDNRFCDLEKI